MPSDLNYKASKEWIFSNHVYNTPKFLFRWKFAYNIHNTPSKYVSQKEETSQPIPSTTFTPSKVKCSLYTHNTNIFNENETFRLPYIHIFQYHSFTDMAHNENFISPKSETIILNYAHSMTFATASRLFELNLIAIIWRGGEVEYPSIILLIYEINKSKLEKRWTVSFHLKVCPEWPRIFVRQKASKME